MFGPGFGDIVLFVPFSFAIILPRKRERESWWLCLTFILAIILVCAFVYILLLPNGAIGESVIGISPGHTHSFYAILVFCLIVNIQFIIALTNVIVSSSKCQRSTCDLSMFYFLTMITKWTFAEFLYLLFTGQIYLYDQFGTLELALQERQVYLARHCHTHRLTLSLRGRDTIMQVYLNRYTCTGMITQ